MAAGTMCSVASLLTLAALVTCGSGSVFVEKGDMIYLMCDASRLKGAAMNLEWVKDSVKIRPEERIRMEFNSVTQMGELTIEHSRESDSGQYSCVSNLRVVETTDVVVLEHSGSAMEEDWTMMTSSAPCYHAGTFLLILGVLINAAV